MLGTSKFWCEAAIVMLAVFMFAGGCDWFKAPLEINILPETTITQCPGEVLAGDDVTITWTGDDADGSVVSFEWTLDDTIAGETSDLGRQPGEGAGGRAAARLPEYAEAGALDGHQGVLAVLRRQLVLAVAEKGEVVGGDPIQKSPRLFEVLLV